MQPAWLKAEVYISIGILAKPEMGKKRIIKQLKCLVNDIRSHKMIEYSQNDHFPLDSHPLPYLSSSANSQFFANLP